MTTIPEHTIDLTAYNANPNPWASNMDLGLFDAQVFSVTSIPDGPAMDELQLANLSGKSPNTFDFRAPITDSKIEAPSIERMPCTGSDEVCTERIIAPDSEEFDDSDPVFILYSDCPAPTRNTEMQSEQPIFGHIGLEKAFGRVELILEGEDAGSSDVSATAMERFKMLCSELDELSEKVTAVTPV